MASGPWEAHKHSPGNWSVVRWHEGYPRYLAPHMPFLGMHAAKKLAAEVNAAIAKAACATCNGHGMIGGFVGGGAPGYVSEACPDCNNTAPLAALQPAALAAARAFGAGLDEQSLEQGEPA